MLLKSFLGKQKKHKVENLLIILILLNICLFLIFAITHHYRPILMFLHILSLLILWIFIGWRLKLIALIKHNKREVLLIIFLIFVAFCVRIYKIEEITPPMYGDEVSVAQSSLDLLKISDWIPFDGTYPHVVYSHPTPLMYMTIGSIALFGHTITAMRLPIVIFAAISVGLFYIFLRLFFQQFISLLGSSLMVFQYTHLVLSRLDYEPPASLFFQILTAIFLVLYVRSKEWIYLIAIALSLGGGMYTYLNFRPFFLFVFLLIFWFIYHMQIQKRWKLIMVFGISLFIAVMPLLSFITYDFSGFWMRSNSISIFSRHYTTVEFFKELGGNMYRTAAIPFIGDPNPDKNPSNVPLIDGATLILAGLGLIYLFQKKRGLFWLLIFFLLPAYISDIFSTEVIPEFHYYGLGHPNALRISGVIPVILFASAYGLFWISSVIKIQEFNKNFYLGVGVGGICIWNCLLYFNQADIYPVFYLYNYKYNNTRIIQLTQFINQSSARTIALDTSLANDNRIAFFLNPQKKVIPFHPISSNDTIEKMQKVDITAIDVKVENLPVLQKLVTASGSAVPGYDFSSINNPLGDSAIIMFTKNSDNH